MIVWKEGAPMPVNSCADYPMSWKPVLDRNSRPLYLALARQLADDVMKPYRPYVDELVYQLYRNGNTQLTKKVKGELLRLLFVDTRFDKVVRPLEVGLMFSASSLAKCFAGTQKKIAYPLLE